MSQRLVVGERKRNASYNFMNLAQEEAKEGNFNDIKKLLETCPEDKKEEFTKNLSGFQRLFNRFVDNQDQQVEWEKIAPPPEDRIKPYADLKTQTPTDIKNLLNKLVVLKLNGGLGTTMGCTGPKSVITVRNDLTFLDMQVQQIESLNNKYGCSIPLVLMNSFNTHEDTQKVLRKYIHVNVKLYCFQQSQYPRLYKESLHTVAKTINMDDHESWYPPGHGDMYQSFYNSGLLSQFIEEGKEYVFSSNIDNLGATVDLSILNFLVNQKEDEKCEFVMEVTDKTRADVKGGTLIRYKDTLRLLEIAQVPKQHVQSFKSVSKFRIFNTNNLWVKLDAIKRAVENNDLHMEIINNQKQLDNGEKIIQLETAIGAAIKSFNKSIGVNVPRSRFLPVKTCSDLFLIMSNLYTIDNGTLMMNQSRQFSTTPLIQLGHFFKKVKEYLHRFVNIPDILELDHLTVAGDVTFGRNITLKGTVIIVANHGDRIDIPSGAILENKIVSGNLRILDH
ncbi:UTP--glucose-1-phosphate uridylyltransferase-like isoform X1 [Hydractinia symbiolongicarpus]|uniref:UTP--glucose-1-phosphate uridylyltransferase-like isoform X1 n=2 Tax=Hydractinia symbiolongicarpus TaxID=13093 RepID=UPI00254EED02|nr:UTP--glucose-1-phosphate uridylyltransferase-like isoform X1 [Hydractinia symbiolongicarpus]XP_057315410.1 UTP--glucose-1-phosphate uridylyltransferase-like isoform X1 [Hydractinia symbiolongicarpus]